MTSFELSLAERAAVDATRRSETPRIEPGDWIGFGLCCQLRIGQILRAHVRNPDDVEIKPDGSPATRIEHRIEELVRERLAELQPDATFVGEESGGALPDAGLAVAVDPVDGTWAFLNETATWTSTLAVFRDGRAIAGFVVNPVTGELVYARPGSPTRSLRLGAFGEEDRAVELPTVTPDSGPPLVNLHPYRGAQPVHSALLEAWSRDELGVVRASGGSPAHGLVEAARGHYIYVNLWGAHPAAPYELAAGLLVVRSAGGDVVDLDGAPIGELDHTGPWIAGVDAGQRTKVAALVRAALPPSAR